MEQFERLWNEIGSCAVMTFATCADGRVTARPMSVAVIAGRFYLQTSHKYVKYQQVKTNPNAALSFGRFSVECVCRDLGHPLDNEVFMTAMTKCYPDAVKRWSSLPEERVIEMTPAIIKGWIYENDVPYIEYWDFTDNTYRKERQ